MEERSNNLKQLIYFYQLHKNDLWVGTVTSRAGPKQTLPQLISQLTTFHAIIHSQVEIAKM